MDKKERYEQMYERLLSYEQQIHEKNQKRIRIGLKCIWIIPLIFLVLLFWTESNKVIFLILWIVSLFGIAVYLIVVEYLDYNLQAKLNELSGESEEGTIDALLGEEMEQAEINLKNAIRKLDGTLNSEAETGKKGKKEEK